MLYILLGAQRVQREARWAAAHEAEEHARGYGHYGANDSRVQVNSAEVHDCVERVIGYWFTWSEETERWRAGAGSLEGQYCLVAYSIAPPLRCCYKERLD